MSPLLFATEATDNEIKQWARENLECKPITYVPLNTLLPDGDNTAEINWMMPSWYPVRRFKEGQL